MASPTSITKVLIGLDGLMNGFGRHYWTVDPYRVTPFLKVDLSSARTQSEAVADISADILRCGDILYRRSDTHQSVYRPVLCESLFASLKKQADIWKL